MQKQMQREVNTITNKLHIIFFTKKIWEICVEKVVVVVQDRVNVKEEVVGFIIISSHL